MTYNTLRYAVDAGVATVTLARPGKLNAFTSEMMREIIAVIDQTDADDEVRAVIFTGEGRAFCAGADLSSGAEGFSTDSPQLLEHPDGSINYASDAARDGGGLVTLRLYESLKPLIAAVNGAAVGLGATMTLPMDIRIASEAARFGFVFARRGIVPEAASSFFLPRIVGISQAAEWCFSGRVFDAAEALRGGLVRSLHAPDELLPAARAIALEIADGTAPVSVALTRQMLWRGLGMAHPMEAHRIDSRAIVARSRSADAAEGVSSFLEKRPAQFPDRVSKDMPDFFPWWDAQPYG